MRLEHACSRFLNYGADVDRCSIGRGVALLDDVGEFVAGRVPAPKRGRPVLAGGEVDIVAVSEGDGADLGGRRAVGVDADVVEAGAERRVEVRSHRRLRAVAASARPRSMRRAAVPASSSPPSGPDAEPSDATRALEHCTRWEDAPVNHSSENAIDVVQDGETCRFHQPTVLGPHERHCLMLAATAPRTAPGLRPTSNHLPRRATCPCRRLWWS